MDCDGVVEADMKLIAALLATLTAIASPATTFAATDASPVEPLAPPVAPAPPPGTADTPVEQGRWYGWELIASDALFLVLANDRGHETGLGDYGLTLGLLGVALVPPALHFIHGNRRRAAYGLVLRGLTVLLMHAAVIAPSGGGSSCNGEDGCIGLDSGDFLLVGLAMVSLIGTIAYVFIDDFWFSRVPVAAAPQPRRAVAPTAFLRPGGGGLGLAGTF